MKYDDDFLFNSLPYRYPYHSFIEFLILLFGNSNFLLPLLLSFLSDPESLDSPSFTSRWSLLFDHLLNLPVSKPNFNIESESELEPIFELDTELNLNSVPIILLECYKYRKKKKKR